MFEAACGSGYILHWRSSWSSYVFDGLLDNNLRTRRNMTDYVLPVILELDELSLAHLIDLFLEEDNQDSRATANCCCIFIHDLIA